MDQTSENKTLRGALKKISDELPSAKASRFKEHPLALFIRYEFPALIRQVLGERVSDFTIQSSPGKGNWADVPWLSILNPRITKNTQGGIYPVFLFCSDGTGVYLSLIQGTSKPRQILGTDKAKDQIDRVKNECRERIPALKGWGLDVIDLKPNTQLSKTYEEANIQARFYSANAIPSEEELSHDLLFLVDTYKQSESLISEVLSETAKTPGLQERRVTSVGHSSDAAVEKTHLSTPLPKPFLLLAGISGVGKTRFVRKQAEMHGINLQNYCLVSVRPDWHEPSDLLGYISRLGRQGPRYVVTDFLRFLVSAWKDAVASFSEGRISWKKIDDMVPYWLCLDEMNLAPVEQYFADYLSVLETREWSEGGYFCDPLLKSAVLHQLDEEGLAEFWTEVDLSGDGPKEEGLRDFFIDVLEGIPLPPNLIVAGTVNMDETTHSFSRKVIDRALTLDFGEFFPNDFNEFFEQPTSFRPLGIPIITHVQKIDLSSVKADPDGKKTINFLTVVNRVLAGTPFELAYRALNEAFSLVLSFHPEYDRLLQASWDDFLMAKVLPRIEGDADTLASDGEKSLLTELFEILSIELSVIWDGKREDFLRINNKNDARPLVDCRSKRKLMWMENRLKTSGFTSFWP
ncbi:MAG: DUF3578 domain-containing protein [Synergistaceae bacterium]|nr:DUF3578 domain-containing protein [Synergistaceae bacterium]